MRRNMFPIENGTDIVNSSFAKAYKTSKAVESTGSN